MIQDLLGMNLIDQLGMMEDKWEKNYHLENLVIVEEMIPEIFVVIEMTETMRIEVIKEMIIVGATISMIVGDKTINQKSKLIKILTNQLLMLLIQTHQQEALSHKESNRNL